MIVQRRIKIKKRVFYLLLVALIMSGCGSLLPSTKQITRSPWDSFDDAKSSFDKIILYETTVNEMRTLGFDPFTTPNIKILTHVDIMNRFMPNASITKEDLDEGIQSCINAKANCKGYAFSPQVIQSKRYGNVILDLFNFRRKSRESGWNFQALIVLVDDIVVYKLWGGNPIIDEFKDRKNPLGPLQDSGDLFIEAVKPDL